MNFINFMKRPDAFVHMAARAPAEAPPEMERATREPRESHERATREHTPWVLEFDFQTHTLFVQMAEQPLCQPATSRLQVAG